MSDQSIIEAIHPGLDIPQYRLFHDAYMGGSYWDANRYLFRHRLEDAQDHDDRIKRSVYMNKAREVVDAHIARLFANDWQVTTADGGAVDETIMTDADRAGTGFWEFVQSATTWADILRFVLVVVDVPSAPDAPASLESAIAAGVRPYLSWHAPQSLVNFQLGPDGKFKWAVIGEEVDESEIIIKDGLPFASAKPVRQRRLWTPEYWVTYRETNNRWERYADGEHPVGMVPIVPLRLFQGPGNFLSSLSRLEDIAPLQVALFNLYSLLYEILHQQTFGQLVIQADPADLVRGAGENETPKSVLRGFGATRAMLMPKDSTIPPQYISPPGHNVLSLQSEIKETQARIDELGTNDAGQRGETPGESGLAKLIGWQSTEAVLKHNFRNIADAFEMALHISDRWLGRDTEYTIQQPTRFGFADPYVLLQYTDAQLRLYTDKALRARIYLRAIQEHFPEIKADEASAIAERQANESTAGDPFAMPQQGGEF